VGLHTSCDSSDAQNLEVVGRLTGSSWKPGEGFRVIDEQCVSYTGLAKRFIGRVVPDLSFWLIGLFSNKLI
jgi:hypothetical protein